MSVVGDILPDEGVKDTIKRSGPIPARPAWEGQPSKVYREFNARHTGEWLPRPYHGRIMNAQSKLYDSRNRYPAGTANRVFGDTKAERSPAPDATAIHLMIVPGPGGLLQIVKVDLSRPVARGFRTKEDAREWIGRAVRAGVLPQGVIEVEPPVSET